MQEYCTNTSSNISLGYLLESLTEAILTKYPKYAFYEEIRIKQGFSYILFCPLRVLCNNKFILMVTSLGTNAVVAMRVHCSFNGINIIIVSKTSVSNYNFSLRHTNGQSDGQKTQCKPILSIWRTSELIIAVYLFIYLCLF